MSSWYAFHDSNPDQRRYSAIEPHQAADYNSKGFGIFYTVNSFNGGRKIENLAKINSWYVDLDDQQLPLDHIIRRAPFFPSSVTYSKRGAHIIYHAKDASLHHYKTINKRLHRLFSSGESVYDVARLLRVPSYFHLKDPSSPFLVKRIFEADFAYTEAQMLAMLKKHPDEEKKPEEIKSVYHPPVAGEDYFSKIHSADQEVLLQMLSGKACVNYEAYSFRRAGKNKNILVNGKGTSCFIDSQKRIGGHVGGGFPSVYEWLRYYNYSHKEVMNILKQEIGEL